MRRQGSITGSPLFSGLQPSPMFSSLQGDQDVVANFICWFSNNGFFSSGLGVSMTGDGVTSVAGTLVDVNFLSGVPASWIVNWNGVSVGGFGSFTLNISINGTVNGFFTVPNGVVGIFLSGAADIIYGTIAYHEVVYFDGAYRHPKDTVLKPAVFSEFLNGEPGRFFRHYGNYVTVFWIGKHPADLPSSNFKPTDYGLVQVPTQFHIPQP